MTPRHFATAHVATMKDSTALPPTIRTANIARATAHALDCLREDLADTHRTPAATRTHWHAELTAWLYDGESAGDLITDVADPLTTPVAHEVWAEAFTRVLGAIEALQDVAA